MAIQACIRAISIYLPPKKLTNLQLEQEFPEWDANKISDKTGISVRGLAEDSETASDLGIAAAKKLFDSGVCRPEDIDFLFFCTQSPDYFLPTTACVIQHALGLPTHAGAFDFNLGCSGYVYGLSIAKGILETNGLKRGLLITAETYSKYINKSDRSVRTLFSDGAAATLIELKDSESSFIGPFAFGTDGSCAADLIVEAGGHRTPKNDQTKEETQFDNGIRRSKENLEMKGGDIFNFTLRTLPKVTKELYAKANITAENIDYYVFHQANKYMLTYLQKKLRIPDDKFCINLENFGNTVSSTIPMAFGKAVQDNEINPGDLVMLVGFGVGASWAATLVTIEEDFTYVS